MNMLASRKQRLISESELNRDRLGGDMAKLAEGIHMLANRAKSVGLIASSAAVLMAGVAAYKRGKPASAGKKPSWLQKIRKGAGMISTLWMALPSRGRNPNDR